jgi:NAD(P)-dependent dehydrogenase (short-subunit alcohol dehydrogenase family)
MSGRLAGKAALITGGGTGIGAGIAELFVAEGAKVVISGRREEKLLRKVEALGSSAAYFVGDVSAAEDAKAMVDKVVELYGKIDILVNNAGVDKGGLAHEIELETWAEVIDTNLNGPFLTSRFALQQMVETGGGALVHVASVVAYHCIAAMPAYTASKNGLIGLSAAIAFDYGRYGIRSNVVAPGGVRTEMSEVFLGGMTPPAGFSSMEEFMTQYLPIPRIGYVTEIAEATLYLASDSAAYTTGVVLPVDGGDSIVDPVSPASKQLAMMELQPL